MWYTICDECYHYEALLREMPARHEEEWDRRSEMLREQVMLAYRAHLYEHIPVFGGVGAEAPTP